MANHRRPARAVHDKSLTCRPKILQVGFFLPAVSLGRELLLLPHHSHLEPRLRRYLVGSAIGFLMFTAILTSWVLNFSLGGEHLFGDVWDNLDYETGNGANKKKFTCNKFHWKPEEDAVLTELVQKIGPNNWELIAKHFRGRTGKSCRLRWVNQLDPDIVKTPFTVEEKRRLLELHQCFGNKWALIAKQFSGRTDNQVKNQYHVLVGSRTIRASSPPPGDDTEDAPEEESMNLSHFENISTLASGSHVTNVSNNRDYNSGFDPFSDVTPYRVEMPFIDNGRSVYGKDEMWLALAPSGSNLGMIDPHSFDNANLGYINSDQNTIWDNEMNSDLSYTELLNLPAETPPQQGYVKDRQFIDFFGLETP